jgi:hypothetical protein
MCYLFLKQPNFNKLRLRNSKAMALPAQIKPHGS